jgi:hypothetical protein
MNALYKSARNSFASAFWLQELHDLNIRVHDTERDKRIIHYRNDRLHVVTCGYMWLHVATCYMWSHVVTCVYMRTSFGHNVGPEANPHKKRFRVYAVFIRLHF